MNANLRGHVPFINPNQEAPVQNCLGFLNQWFSSYCFQLQTSQIYFRNNDVPVVVHKLNYIKLNLPCHCCSHGDTSSIARALEVQIMHDCNAVYACDMMRGHQRYKSCMLALLFMRETCAACNSNCDQFREVNTCLKLRHRLRPFKKIDMEKMLNVR